MTTTHLRRKRQLNTMPNWFLSCWVLLATAVSVAEAVCPLCETLQDYPKRMQFLVAPGTRCQDIYVDLGRYQPTDQFCIRSKNLYQELCCGDEEPEPIVAPTEPPVFTGPRGPEPDCYVCRETNEFPGIPNQFIVARYVGDYTCAQLYQRGNNGYIPWFMCGPLQDFTYSACGCGEFNPNFNSSPRPTPTPLNNSNPPPPPPPPPPTPRPTSAPTQDRRTPPSGAKYQRQKLGALRGGAAGAYYRGNRRALKGETSTTSSTTSTATGARSRGDDGSNNGGNQSAASLPEVIEDTTTPMFQTI